LSTPEAGDRRARLGGCQEREAPCKDRKSELITLNREDLIGSVSILLVCPVLWLGGCTADIIVLDMTADIPYLEEGLAVLPLSLTVKNAADEVSMGVFKVAAWYTHPSTDAPEVAAFDVPGQTSMWFPQTSGSLAPGDEETFEGLVRFPPSIHGGIFFYAEADSCALEQSMPEYCRVLESDENNNESNVLVLSLP
jgi:hypothetical protein